jgi:hypothetical protein
MIACELLIAIASYNLIRAVMTEAARQVDIEPRRLSFPRSRSGVSPARWRTPHPMRSLITTGGF